METFTELSVGKREETSGRSDRTFTELSVGKREETSGRSDRRTFTELSVGKREETSGRSDRSFYKQLLEYEETLFGSTDSSNLPLPVFPSFSSQSFSFGSSKTSNPVPTFSNTAAVSVLSQPITNISPQEFTFGASHLQNVTGLGLTGSSPSSNCGDISMDSS